MYLFYTPELVNHPELLASNFVQSFFLSEEESAHCVRVLRYNRGDQILLTDGCGTTYTALIVNPHPKHCEFQVVACQKQQPSHHFHLHIAIAPTKNVERLEWMVEKCTEIGVDEITPLLCHYSERRQLRLDRLQKIVLSATKQSLTPFLPVLNDLTPFSEFVQRYQPNAYPNTDCFIAHCYEEDKSDLKAKIRPNRDVLVLIGPEGDFSENEISEAVQHGFIPVSLGNSRLRTETAGVVACHTAILMNA